MVNLDTEADDDCDWTLGANQVVSLDHVLGDENSEDGKDVGVDAYTYF